MRNVNAALRNSTDAFATFARHVRVVCEAHELYGSGLSKAYSTLKSLLQNSQPFQDFITKNATISVAELLVAPINFMKILSELVGDEDVTVCVGKMAADSVVDSDSGYLTVNHL